MSYTCWRRESEAEGLADIDRPKDLPDFERSPLVEVAIGVQFERLHQLRQAHLGVFWETIREQYPQVEDHPPLDPVVEVPEGTQLPAFQVEVSEFTPIQRSWFVSADRRFLLQLQSDRLIQNWRGEGTDYPSYESLRSFFVKSYEILEAMLSREDLGVLRIHQAEINYINRIAPVKEITEFFRGFSAARLQVPGVIPTPRSGMLSLHYDMDVDPWYPSRLHVVVEPFQPADGDAGYLLRLTVRGAVRGHDLEAAVTFFDHARSAIVRSFIELTTERMHTEWGRKQWIF